MVINILFFFRNFDLWPLKIQNGQARDYCVICMVKTIRTKGVKDIRLISCHVGMFPSTPVIDRE